MDVCIFCNKTLTSEETVTVLTAKGCAGIAKANGLRKEDIQTRPGQTVHKACRQTFCNPKSIQLAQKRQRDQTPDGPRPSTRKSSGSTFEYQGQCIFCGQGDRFQGKVAANILNQVKTVVFQQSISEVCETRSDIWSQTVKARIEYVQDLFAADAVYHPQCSINFRTGRQIPQQFICPESQPSKKIKQGRPFDC